MVSESYKDNIDIWEVGPTSAMHFSAWVKSKLFGVHPLPLPDLFSGSLISCPFLSPPTLQSPSKLPEGPFMCEAVWGLFTY